MIDQVFIHIKSGSGGDGAISGRHEKFIPRGGPDGGDGGDGGNVIIIGDRNENTLLPFRFKRWFKAGDGSNGKSAKKKGHDGIDEFIHVPVGTQVCSKDGLIEADVTEHGQEHVVACGGRGGYGNVKYTSSTNQYPVIAQAGERGIETVLKLDLKLIADVGIIGSPNAGKSSLITLLTKASPKIAEYPFTTIDPVLGVVDYKGINFVMVDIPGLIEGAHDGAGLGHEFLRHVERTRVLIHMVDGSAEDPDRNFRLINEELRLFDERLAKKPQVLALNKVDLEEVRVLQADILETLGEQSGRFHVISAVSGEGVEDLMNEVLKCLDSDKLEKRQAFNRLFEDLEKDVGPDSISEDQEIPTIVPEPRRRGVSVYLEEGIDADVFVVSAPGVERVAERIDYEDWMARMQMYRHMQKTGVVRALEDAGIKSGDTVRLGTVEWDWD